MQSFLKPTAFVSIPVARLKKSAAFYQGKLGFRETRRDDALGWLELEQLDGPLKLGLAEVQDVSRGGPVLVLEVTDILSAREALQQQKIKVSNIEEVPGIARVATFSDPDDHAIMLRQSL